MFAFNFDPQNLKNRAPATAGARFSKNRLSKLCTFLIPFGCQLASIFPPQIHQNPFKNRFQEASIFSLILASIFVRFGLHLGAQVGTMLAHFPPKWSAAVRRRLSFCWVYVIFQFFGRPGPLLAQFGLDFGRFGLVFWKFSGVHFEGVWSRFASPCGL